MFAPPNRNGCPSRTRCEPARVTKPAGAAVAPETAPRSVAAQTRNRVVLARRTQASSGTVRGRGRTSSWFVAVGAILAVAASSTRALSAPPAVAFGDRGGSLVLTTSAYTLTLTKRNGKVLNLVDRATGAGLARNADRCLWGVAGASNTTYVGGCSFAPGAARRFSYRWNRAASTLTLTYRSSRPGTAVVTL